MAPVGGLDLYGGLIVPLAHFGHWWTELIFAAPVLVLGLVLTFDTVRTKVRRRRERRG